ncbi:MAG: MlaD family protein [Pseudomonadota bacterium]
METKANYVAVGTFSLIVILATFGFIYWLYSVDTGAESAELNIVIEGSVTGLTNGSPVKFNGIDVGAIRRIDFDADNPRQVIARAVVRRDLPISTETTAVLAFTGLTGIAHIELAGGNIMVDNVFQIAEDAGQTATIKADPSAVTDLVATAQDIFTRADSVLTELESFVSSASGPLTETLENSSRITSALAENADEVDQFLGGIGALGETLEGVTGALNNTLQGVDNLLAAVSPEDVEAMVSDVRGITSNLNEASGDFEELTATATQFLEGIQETGSRLDATVQRIDEIAAAVEPDAVAAAVDSISAASSSIAETAAAVGEISESFQGRTEQIDSIFANTTELAERLNAASARVDGVLAQAESFLGSGSEGGADNLIAEATATLRSFRQTADTLNARLDRITSGLERFSNDGLRDVQGLLTDTRRSITRIEQAIASIEQNPQRLLFGGEGSVKRFPSNGERQRR